MLTKLIQIGNSQGIRIGSQILEQCGFKDEIEMDILQDKSILLRPVVNKPREGWKDAFKKMSKEGDDEMLIPDGLDLDLLGEGGENW
jgi:antitoxin MazE